MTTVRIEIEDEYIEEFYDFINTLPKDSVVVTHSENSNDKKVSPTEEARISGVSYVSEQDYSADKDDFFKALHGK